MALLIFDVPDCHMRNDEGENYARAWHMSLGRDGTVDLYGRNYFGGDGVPYEVFHKVILEWDFRTMGDGTAVDRAELARDLSEGGKLAKLLKKVHAGHSVEWDGNNNIGVLDDDALKASERIRKILEDYPIDDWAPPLMDASLWFSDDRESELLEMWGLHAQSTRREIDEAVLSIEAEVLESNIELINTREFVIGIIEEAREDGAGNGGGG